MINQWQQEGYGMSLLENKCARFMCREFWVETQV